MPEPLVPVEVDLRGYEFIPLFGDRLFGSETWIGITAEAKLAALQLWWRAYAKEVPAASLPDNDALLANYAGYGTQTKAWLKVKAQAMRGFVRCTDERWYHPFIAELALDAWKGRKAHQTRTLKARIAALQKRKAAATTDDDRAHLEGLSQELQQELTNALKQPVTEVCDRLSNTVPKERDRERTGTGRGQDKEKPEDQNPLSGKPDAPPNGHDYLTEAKAVLGYLNRTTGRKYREVSANLKPIVVRLKSGVTPEQMNEVVLSKARQWARDPKMNEYLRPKTLFTETNFEQYLGEISS